MSQEQYTLQDVCDAIGDLEQTLDKKDRADGTNWTVADGVSGIYYMLEEIKDILKDMNKNNKQSSRQRIWKQIPADFN